MTRSRSKNPPRSPFFKGGTKIPDGDQIWAGASIIAIAAVAAYLPSLRGGFLLDDNILLTGSPLVRASDGLYRIWLTTEAVDYWPVTNTSFWLEWRLWGMNPAGYHVTNLTLHVVAASLIWAVLSSLSVPGAFLAALFFAVHPVNVEAVAWIAQRKSLLAMVFFLLSILCWILWMQRVERDLRARSAGERGGALRAPERARRSRSTSEGMYWLSLAAFVLAMLSKASVAILPLVLLGITGAFRPLARRDLLRTAPFFIVAVVLVFVNVWYQSRNAVAELPDPNLIERVLRAAAAVWFYLSKAVLPLDLSFVYPQWRVEAGRIVWWIPLVGVVTTTVVLWRLRRTGARPALVAWMYFGVALLPVLGLTDVAFMEHSPVADHYQYVALAGVTALIAAEWTRWQTRATVRWPLKLAALAVVILLTVLTFRQSRLYADPMALYRATLRANPESWLIHGNLGGKLADAGRLPEAIEHFREALRLNPDFADAHGNLGAALRDLGRPWEAIEHFELALRSSPNVAETHNNLGNALRDTGRLDEAIARYERALEIRRDYPEAQNNLGAALAESGRLDRGIEHLREALRLRPDYASARRNLDVALAARKQAAAERP